MKTVDRREFTVPIEDKAMCVLDMKKKLERMGVAKHEEMILLEAGRILNSEEALLSLEVAQPETRGRFLVVLVNPPKRTIRKKASKEQTNIITERQEVETVLAFEVSQLDFVISEHLTEKKELIGAIEGLEMPTFEERVKKQAREQMSVQTEDLFSNFLAEADAMKTQDVSNKEHKGQGHTEALDIPRQTEDIEEEKEETSRSLSSGCANSASPESMCQITPTLASSPPNPLYTKDPNMMGPNKR